MKLINLGAPFLYTLLAVGGFTATNLPVQAQSPAAPDSDKLPDAFSAVGSGISYFNTPNRHHTTVNGSDATVLGKVSVDLKNTTDVLVQFTSGLATIADDGCPCSYRASLKADNEEPIVIKRVNLAVRAPQPGKYVPDRQSADGSFVFSLPRGKHEIALVIQKIDGSTQAIQAFYTNIQAIPFERK